MTENQEEKLKIQKIADEIQKEIEKCQHAIDSEIAKLKTDKAYSPIFDAIFSLKTEESFKRIGGLANVKQVLYETLILPNLRPDLFHGLRLPARGVLMYGPPGNGKTMIAKATAQECQGTFFSVSASTLVSKFVGDSEKYLKNLFHVAYLLQPSVIFIDEVDSILTARSSEENEASRRLKTEFLVQFDGMGSWKSERVFLLAATNRPYDIDSAALRRFNRRIMIPLPDSRTREKIIMNLIAGTSNKIKEQEIKEIAKMAHGYSASDLTNVLRDAAFEAIRKIGKEEIVSMTRNKVAPLSFEDVKNSLKRISPSVSPKELLELKKWEEANKNV